MNRILYADDCLNVLNDELVRPGGSVDLIYLDPPFNSQNRYNLPFKGQDKDARPVEAFNDTWTWGAPEDEALRELAAGPQSRQLADIVNLAGRLDIIGRGGRRKYRLDAYLLNMATWLLAMRRVLADTGSIYLHCDPTASHYLKLVMDAIFGKQNFRNEIIWHYNKWTNAASHFQRNHDVIMFYSQSPQAWFSKPYHMTAHKARVIKRGWDSNRVNGIRQLLVYDRIKAADEMTKSKYDRIVYRDADNDGTAIPDVWSDINYLGSASRERLGYPTQKPVALLERIVMASSPPGGLVLDPFCGCGTAVHAAEQLGRRWIGVDLSAFATGLVRERILRNFEQLTTDDVIARGVPVSVTDAAALARRDQFEFEKWVCGAMGAEGMFHEPGTRGADGGVDGVLRFYPFRLGRKPTPEFAIIQVKGGNVTPDAVKALQATVDRFGATAGVIVCFDRFMRTVQNQRSRATFADDSGAYPVIQGYSVEDLLAGKPLDLPLYGYRRRGGRIGDQSELMATRNRAGGG